MLGILSLYILPLCSCLVLLLLGNKLPRKGDWFAIGAIVASLVASILVFVKVWNAAPIVYATKWISIGNTTIGLNIFIDNVAALMLLLVSSIALLVHLYSVVYMHNDEYYHRYWAYLSLFCFAMLGLVMTTQLLQMYIFWELVGVSSYLLIGFWFTKPEAGKANKKAFLINRVGDIGFLLAIAIVYAFTQNLDIRLWNNAPAIPPFWMNVAGFGFFLAVMAKSAQFPLHIWLPDAMVGPTSVSALIHAATMVAAGVFLMYRVYPIFSTEILLLAAVVGCFTALMASLFALLQRDIKRILAFSTIAQLGYMVCAMGVGAPQQALFHLITHAFFKCLLFLCAGVIIHQLHHLFEKHYPQLDAQDIYNMGGLKKRMPVVFWTMLIACIALSGLPLSSGALSKENILLSAFSWAESGGGAKLLVPILLLISSVLTSVYCTKLVYVVFIRNNQVDDKGHDFSLSILYKIPLLVLSVMSLWFWISASPLSAQHSWLLKGIQAPLVSHHEGFILMLNVVLLIAIGLTFQTLKNYYHRQQIGSIWRVADACKTILSKLVQPFAKPEVQLGNAIIEVSEAMQVIDKKGVDKVVEFAPKAVLKSSTVAEVADKSGIDYLVNTFASMSQNAGRWLKITQSGKVQNYIVWILAMLLLALAGIVLL